ncbi:MAG: CBS domain-containing protein [Calditrichaeota bacterium]|nr:CBS domain-containing protein [Calditrichota bacterium]
METDLVSPGSWPKKVSAAFVRYTQFSQTTYILILGIIVGVLSGFVAVGFRLLIAFFQTFSIKESSGILGALQQLPIWWKILLPVLGGAIVGPIIYFFAREAKGHGVPEVMQAIALKNGVIRPRVAVVKSLASAITLSTGGSVGQEGPIIQVGSAVGSTIGQWLNVSPERLKILVGCGAAAGIAATFNAPIAGAFFALEIIIGNFGLLSFSPIIISSVMATVISRAFFGSTPIFAVPLYSLVSVWEIPLYIALGIFAGLVGLAFTESVYASERFFDNLKMPEYLKTPFGGIFLGVLIVLSPHVFGGGYESIGMMLKGKFVWQSLLFLLVLKLLATSVTLGSGGSGGIFAPALLLGAASGGAFGKLAHSLFPETTASSGAYAMVGMGAVVAAATHAPITSILILFEITNDYKIILPVMIACTIATVLARRLNQDSIYTMKLSLRGISLNQGREEIIMRSFSVGDLMHPKTPVINEKSGLKEIIRIFMKYQDPFYYVVNNRNVLRGILSTHMVKSILSESEKLDQLIIAQDLVEPTDMATPDMTLADCMQKFERTDCDHLPVIENEKSKKLIGTISRKDIIKLYNHEILRKDVLGVKYIRDFGSDQLRNMVQLPRDFKVDFIPAPGEFIGHSIRELNLRTHYNITVLAVKKKISEIGPSNELPDPERIFAPGDIMVVAGKESALEKFRKLAIQE